MTPEERQLVKDLRAAIEKKSDAAERKELADKLANLERSFERESQLERDAAGADALLARAKRMVFWGRIAIGAFLLALCGAVAWFWSKALHVF